MYIACYLSLPQLHLSLLQLHLSLQQLHISLQPLCHCHLNIYTVYHLSPKNLHCLSNNACHYSSHTCHPIIYTACHLSPKYPIIYTVVSSVTITATPVTQSFTQSVNQSFILPVTTVDTPFTQLFTLSVTIHHSSYRPVIQKFTLTAKSVCDLSLQKLYTCHPKIYTVCHPSLLTTIPTHVTIQQLNLSPKHEHLMFELRTTKGALA